MQDFLEFVVSGLVQHPESVSVTPVTKGDLTLFELRMDPSDVGKIIGKDGRTAGALRTLLRAVGAKQGKRALLEIVA